MFLLEKKTLRSNMESVFCIRKRNWMMSFKRIDRILLMSYVAAIFILLLLPIPEPKFYLLGIKSDKWFHAALFGGFVILLRWNLSGTSFADKFSLGAALVLAIVTEVAQGQIVGRNFEMTDVVADLVGSMIGIVIVNRVLSSPFPEKAIGFLIAVLGFTIAVLSLTADLVGSGNTRSFGPDQLAGTILGVIVLGGGLAIRFSGFQKT